MTLRTMILLSLAMTLGVSAVGCQPEDHLYELSCDRVVCHDSGERPLEMTADASVQGGVMLTCHYPCAVREDNHGQASTLKFRRNGTGCFELVRDERRPPRCEF